MTKTFEFIDSTKSDRLTRRLARSHAMKGKNAGKKLHRRSRLAACKQTVSPRLPERASQFRSDGENSGDPVHRFRGIRYKALGEELLSVSFPVEATLRSQYVIKEFFAGVVDALYPPNICRPLDDVKSQWLRLLFINRTSYHCSLALMSTMNEFFLGRKVFSPKATYHLAQAVSLVNQSLDTAEALSDSNLAVVTFLIVQELVRESKSPAEVHLKGLKKMIELRGGLSQLWGNDMLAVKICKTDLDYALHHGTATCFYRDRMSDVALELGSEGFFIDRELANSGSRFNRMDPFLQQILLDVTQIAALFNSDYTDFKMDPQMLQEIIVSVGCRLVRFHKLCGPLPATRLESACHIGLTAFIATFFIQTGHRRFLKYGLISQCLGDVIDNGLDEEDNDLMLWLLFVGGTSVWEGLDQPWLVLKIRQIARSLGLEDWATLHQCLAQFPWINSLHDAAGKALWDAVNKAPIGVRASTDTI